MGRILIVIIVTLYVSGCSTVPPPQGQVSYASYVADRSTVAFDEIMVTMPGSGTGELRNLHIKLAAIVNPVEKSKASEYDVQSIVRRTQTRIESELVQDISAGSISLDKGQSFMLKQIESSSSKVFGAAYDKWEHSKEFKVEIVVTSLYFTNGSVAKPASGVRLGWFD